MSKWFRSDSTAPTDEERDVMLADALHVLDPMSSDPNYWFRFRGWVMTGAARELSRRRRLAELTVADVLTAWARTVVPTAALAAALAAMMLLRGDIGPSTHLLGVEDLLLSDIPSETVPVLLSPDAAAGVVAFASEIF
ncbi:MAG: hypothetical protein O2958_10920 [Gemmatimonadetes bacterium]|nr:hypothetical protein [Gemmatimonadota bacterium]MDA1104472.1 hypothetical protein [Gemmatimonadota bacterium]